MSFRLSVKQHTLWIQIKRIVTWDRYEFRPLPTWKFSKVITWHQNQTKPVFLQRFLAAFQVFFYSQPQCFSYSPHEWLVWRDFAYSWTKFRIDPSSNQSELISISSAPDMSGTGPSTFFEPVSCKLKQGFVWRVISSCIGLTLFLSHVISL